MFILTLTNVFMDNFLFFFKDTFYIFAILYSFFMEPNKLIFIVKSLIKTKLWFHMDKLFKEIKSHGPKINFTKTINKNLYFLSIAKGCKKKNVYRHKNGFNSVNFYITYMLHLSLEAEFYQVFRSYFKIFGILVVFDL